MLYTIRTSAICLLSSIVCRLSSVLKGVLMSNKTLFWSFYANFCAFPQSLHALGRDPVLSWLKNPFNQRNLCHEGGYLRLINYLHAFGIFTTVVSALQIQPFLCKTNPISEKPNERKCFYNNELRTKNYEL